MTKSSLPTLLLLALAACGSPSGGDATLDVAFRTHQPVTQLLGTMGHAGHSEAAITSVVVEVLSIEADIDDAWVTLADQPQLIDLIAMEDGTATALNDALVPAGHYDQVRLMLGDENTLAVDGETLPLRTPSASHSGLKIPLDADIVAGTTYALDLRFDLDHNLVLTGHGWQLTPVLQVVSLDGDDDPDEDTGDDDDGDEGPEDSDDTDEVED